MTGLDHSETIILTVECPGRTGLVAVIGTFLSDRGCFIKEMKQFDDLGTGRFFCRIEFVPGEEKDLQTLSDSFDSIATKFQMKAKWARQNEPMKTMILVSQHDHCLMDLLYRVKKGDLNIEVTKILSNHSVLENIAQFFNVPFEIMPEKATKLATKVAREELMLETKSQTKSELVVLARYMQILSPELCDLWGGECINIHHSFLPGFKGARPYYQAFDRGVKQIGATAHYVTSDLDEGPIIEQEVARVDHTFNPEDLTEMGRNMENLALAKAVKMHSEMRVFLNGSRTVVLS